MLHMFQVQVQISTQVETTCLQETPAICPFRRDGIRAGPMFILAVLVLQFDTH